MSITYKQGSIFNSKAEVLVNPVNTVGVMGGGLAKQFKKRFPDMFTEYRSFCEQGLYDKGVPYFVSPGPHTMRKSTIYLHWWWFDNPPRVIVNLPTKKHWKDPSELTLIEQSLKQLRIFVVEQELRSLAMPYIGCGLGGLKWEDVRLLIENFSISLDNTDIEVWGL